jgi:hypothetical protein
MTIYLATESSSFIGTMSGDGYFFEGLFILISTFCVCADGFKVLRNLYITLIIY